MIINSRADGIPAKLITKKNIAILNWLSGGLYKLVVTTFMN